MEESICNAFRKNPDGSWTCTWPTSIPIAPDGGEIKVDPGTSLTKGVLYMDVDLAKWLDEHCE